MIYIYNLLVRINFMRIGFRWYDFFICLGERELEIFVDRVLMCILVGLVRFFGCKE